MSARSPLLRGRRLAAVIAVIAAVAVLPVIAARLVPVAPAAAPGPASAALAPVASITATLPALAPLTSFDVNDENPFVPMAARVLGRARYAGPAHDSVAQAPGPLAGPSQTVPPLRLPDAHPSRAGFGCVGIVAAHGEASLLVRLSGGATAAVSVGQAVPTADARARWTLEALEPGGIARFRDARGDAQRLAVGDAATVAIAPERL